MKTVPTLKCLKCGYEWIPRKADRPKECPDCKRRNWDADGTGDGRSAAKARGRSVPSRHIRS
jgi:primosomal protein N'